MPLTALVWNIEQFGTNFRPYTSPPLMEALRLQMIAAVVNAAKADVLVIQELRQEGVPLLGRLISLLNGAPGVSNWHYDWLPGSLVTAVSNPNSFSQLGFTPIGNKEGYAVVWRQGALAPFAGSTLSAGVDTADPNALSAKASRDRFLGMVFSGRPLLFSDQQVDITFQTNGSAPLGFPQPVCPERTLVTTQGGTPPPSNAEITQQILVRRPCCVQLQVTSSRQVPLVVLRAAEGQQDSRSPIYATLIGFAADQLQGSDRVYAGNFNIVGDTQQKTLGTYSPKIGYAASTFSNQVPAKSVVQYLKSGGGFLTGDDVRVIAADYAFAGVQTGAAPALTIRNVVDLDIAADNGAIHDVLTDASETFSVTILPDLARVAGQQPANVVNAFFNGQPLPYGADKSTAGAIIHRNFISEHLPVAITYG
jgi:hypothetical protein